MTFTINNKAIPYSEHYELYSDDPVVLRLLLADITVTATRIDVVPSPWESQGRRYDALAYAVTVQRSGRVFDYTHFASHVDAQLYKDNAIQRHGGLSKLCKALQAHIIGLPYDILCCIAADYSITDCEPEDMGMSSDSIRDMAKWGEMRAHSKKLQQCLRLTREELASLPA